MSESVWASSRATKLDALELETMKTGSPSGTGPK
jgi:hypothetical protein